MESNMPYFVILQAKFEIKYCQIWNQRCWICLAAKFDAKLKIVKFGAKYTSFGFFLYWNLKTLLLYLKSVPSSLSNCKILQKKFANLGEKMPYLGIFEREF